MVMPAGLKRYWTKHRRKSSKIRRHVRSVTMSNRKKKFTLPLAVVAGFVPVTANTYAHYKGYGLTGHDSAASEFVRTMTGVDPWGAQTVDTGLNRKGFQPWQLSYGLVPVVTGVIIHKVAGYLGINRAIAQAGVPVIRI